MEKRRSNFFTFFVGVSTLVLGVLIVLGSMRVQRGVSVNTDLAFEGDLLPKEETADILSPDGKYTLTVNQTMDANGLINQSFYITSEKEEDAVLIFEKDSGPEKPVIVPFNTFSPDNEYFFLKHEEAGKMRYTVFRTDGEFLNVDGGPVEIERLFSEEYRDLVITDVTGWGGYSLLVVNTDTLEGKQGPSFWFDVNNFRFTKLASRFN